MGSVYYEFHAFLWFAKWFCFFFLGELFYLIPCFYLVKRHSLILFLLIRVIDHSVINGQIHSEVCRPVPGFHNVEMPEFYHIITLNATGILRTHFKEGKKPKTGKKERRRV